MLWSLGGRARFALPGLFEIAAQGTMDLGRAITAPSLDRHQDEIGLISQGIRAPGLDRVERAFGRSDDGAAGARASDDGDGFDHAEVPIGL